MCPSPGWEKLGKSVMALVRRTTQSKLVYVIDLARRLDQFDELVRTASDFGMLHLLDPPERYNHHVQSWPDESAGFAAPKAAARAARALIEQRASEGAVEVKRERSRSLPPSSRTRSPSPHEFTEDGFDSPMSRASDSTFRPRPEQEIARSQS